MDCRKEYVLEGLSCPNCAAKIEDEVKRLPQVKEANLNLMNQKLSVSMKEETIDIYEAIKSIVASHEPSVKVIAAADGNRIGKEEASDQDNTNDAKNKKSYIIRLGASVILAIIFSFWKAPESIRIAGFLIAYLLSGYEVLVTAGKNILKGEVFDENFLMGIASMGAFLIGERAEAVSVLIFYGVGEMLQDMAVDRSRKNIAGLMDIRPDYANLKNGTIVTTVSPEQVNIDDIILVKPGEKIPLDGIVVNGSSFVDTRALTGESVPVEINVSDLAYSGSINTSGELEIKVLKTFGESTVSKILELVQNSGSKKAKSEKFITKFARYYTPAVVFTAAAVAFIPPLLGSLSFTTWIYRALSFLIISCPCALVISIPISFFGGIGGGARQGVLIRGGNYLDALTKVDTVVFDKTGTLTKGIFAVTKVCPVNGTDEKKLIELAAIAENHSTHPIAKSIMEYYKNITGEDTEVLPASITELAGHGIVAQADENVIYAGNEKLMDKYNIETKKVNTSGTIIHVALNQNYLGYIVISDEIKQGAKETMKALKNYGVRRTVMLTGDRKTRAEEIANECQVDEFQAELLPQDKVAWFESFKRQAEEKGKGKVVFVGDGINDAPVLAGADIGIAMGGIGSDAAIEAADVVIMNDDIGKIAAALKIARKTRVIVNENIIFALGVKLIIMVLAFLGITSIWFAIFADVGVALLAILNAMRAMMVK